jgi:cytidyltransferase-like protein
MSATVPVVVSGGFDDIRARHLRLLQQAAALGEVTVLLWSDESLQKLTGKAPRFPAAERLYLLQAVRYVSRVLVASAPASSNSLPHVDGLQFGVWADEESAQNVARAEYCRKQGLRYHVVPESKFRHFPAAAPLPSRADRKKVIVTGCYDWFHSGHVRFFEEVSTYGELYVVVGHDANIRLLKGKGHPLVSQEERRYLVGSIRHVHEALISTGDGWLDAEPEIRRLKPDIYAVNEDGDKGGKREYCREVGLEYLVLKRTPAPGLAARRSTELRGF